MKIENSSIPLVFVNVGALAVAIIGVVAFKQLGAFSNYAPLKGIIMMSSAGSFFLIELAIYGCTRKKPESLTSRIPPDVDIEEESSIKEGRKLETEQGVVEIVPPEKAGDPWALKLPGYASSFPFEGDYREKHPEENHFVTCIYNSGEQITLIIKYKFGDSLFFDKELYYITEHSERPNLIYRSFFNKLITNGAIHQE